MHNIDPEGIEYFRGSELPNIIGHKHVMPTTCPGDNLAKLLPKIRTEVAKLNESNNNPAFAYEILDISLLKSHLYPGEKALGVVKLKNTGNEFWQNYGKHRISLGSDNPKDRYSQFTKSTRMGYLKELIVKPGQIGHFVFNLKAPEKAGIYEEYFAPVIESITWLEGKGMKFTISVIDSNKLT